MRQPDKILYEAEVTATGGHERCPCSNATCVKLTVL